eukprot:TRINITY_DN13034_c0_g1_i1.p1 TRINITY_DN13034_c0_g1~~TRINITY_DN13034_c0_g1_i1.p1  ORF type:complete len:412 (+),score=112.55 TRINITY_DN13034_c0_g1_i1:37-1272(+)
MAALPASKGLGNVAGMFPQVCGDTKFTYLDSAATTLKPKIVADTIDKYYRQQCATVHRGMYPLALKATDKYQQTRRKVAAFIGARDSQEVVFTKGCTESINLVAQSFGTAFVKKNDEIIITESEHHSNIVPWQLLSQRTGCKLRVVPMNPKTGHLDYEYLRRNISPLTKLVAVQHKSNVTGVTHDIQKISEMAKKHGAKVLVDAAQSCATNDIDVQRMGVDFLALSGHKMFGPTGIGVLYGKRELLNSMPPYQGGGDMVDRVNFEKTTFAPIPQKFEAGTPLISSVIGLGAAVDFIESLGRKGIRAYVDELGNYARKKLTEISEVKLLPSESSVVSFTTARSPLDAATLLGETGFAVRAGHHCCQPLHQKLGISSSLRVSVAPYTTKADIDKFVAALKDVLKQLRNNAGDA